MDKTFILSVIGLLLILVPKTSAQTNYIEPYKFTGCAEADGWCIHGDELLPPNWSYIVVGGITAIASFMLHKNNFTPSMWLLILWVSNLYIFWLFAIDLLWYGMIVIDFVAYGAITWSTREKYITPEDDDEIPDPE